MCSSDLVAFQTDSGYDSYGKKKCDNAPISIESEFSYTTALLKLLEYDSRNKFKINNRIFLFWSSSKETKEFEKEFYNFFNCTDNVVDDPDFHIDLVRKTFKSISTGTPNKLQNDKFYFLGLAPNGKARVAVVYWLEGSLVEFSKYISRYFDDMDIIDKRQIKKNYMGVYQVLRSITLNDDMSKLAPNISETLIKSIMEGTLYPYSLFVACINRIRANQNTPSKNKKKDYYSFLANEISRIAFIKAYLIRNNNDKINVMIDKNNTNQGYLCGRLFATLEYIQERGNGTSTIRSRYMNSASSTPSAVFPTLLNLSIHHSEKLKKDAQIFFELIKTEIIDKITSDGFPSHLNLQDQGRFMVGYYHQRKEFYTPNTKSEKDEIINVEQ